VLLAIGVEDEKGDACSLKLAKDTHVSKTPQKSPKVCGSNSILKTILNPAAVR
jgi:hypothetical protein